MIHVSVPATSANLGSAFDSAAIALNLRMNARATAGHSGLSFDFRGSERPTHSGIEQCILAGMRLFVEDPASLNLHVEVENAIPLGAGLGSSAAATILGAALAARALEHPISRERLLLDVAGLEGHADNAAAALFGGLCFAIEEHGHARALSLPIPPSLRCAFVLPALVLDTATSRNVLPRSYSRRVVALSLQRAAMLAASLANGTLDFLHIATRDCLHQPYRAQLIPGLASALEAADPDSCAMLSGAGPTILVLSKSDPLPHAMRINDLLLQAGIESRVLTATFDVRGLECDDRFAGATLPCAGIAS
ncbi:MAG: homoserine kinase [Vulcanimicrobiaceae bacterium]